jgi:hypothetical protein
MHARRQISIQRDLRAVRQLRHWADTEVPDYRQSIARVPCRRRRAAAATWRQSCVRDRRGSDKKGRPEMSRSWFAVLACSAVVSVSASASQGSDIKGVMREKLGHTQKILEAVVTSDWVSLETHTRELERLTESPRWAVLKFPEYARHSSAFVRAVRDLHEAAAQRDLEKTPTAYVAVTLQCVGCHRYLARTRVAK